MKKYILIIFIILGTTTFLFSKSDKTKGSVPDMKFAFIKGGCFMMGQEVVDEESKEKYLPHEVCLDDFYLGVYEVTNQQFKQFVDETGYITVGELEDSGFAYLDEDASEWGLIEGVNWKHPLWPEDAIKDKMNHPVLQISWNDAQAFVKWLNQKSSRELYRLPTEAEWEYAAREGGKAANPGNEEVDVTNACKFGNVKDQTNLERWYSKRAKKSSYVPKSYPCRDGFAATAPVGSFLPNRLGIYDLLGNGSEWVQDTYAENAYQTLPKNNPLNQQPGSMRINRGCSWDSEQGGVNCAIVRGPDDGTNWNDFETGFRIVREDKKQAR